MVALLPSHQLNNALSTIKSSTVVCCALRHTQQNPDSSALRSWIECEHRKHRTCHWDEGNNKVEIMQMDDTRGYGLVASQNILENEVILSIPMSLANSAIESDTNDLPWNVEMVSNILRQISNEDSQWASWIQSMPNSSCDLPWLVWTDSHIQELQEANIIQEVYAMQQLRDSALDYFQEYEEEDVIWALSMVSSRSFIHNMQHISVPFIDMANHRFDCNSRVQANFSPNACQGQMANDEIAPVEDVNHNKQSTFDLVANEDIEVGQEVSISYGNHPAEVFLLYFGWVPFDNPFDQYILFRDGHECVSAILEILGRSDSDQNIFKFEGGYDRLFVTTAGADPRLLNIISTILDAAGSIATPQYVLKSLCWKELDQYPTTLEKDANLLQETSERYLKTAIEYRYIKKKILFDVITCL